MKALLTKGVPVWVLLVVTVSVLAGGVLATFSITRASLFATNSESINTQVAASVELEEQVVLLALGVEGIEQKRSNSTFFGQVIPGSERAAFLQYTYTAKLGIEGKDVTVTPAGPKRYRVSIPEFIFIGIDQPKLELLVEQNGLLSGVTPGIDQLEMVNHILGSDAKAEQITKHAELLAMQAKAFYSGIVHSIDPEITLDFEFARA